MTVAVKNHLYVQKEIPKEFNQTRRCTGTIRRRHRLHSTQELTWTRRWHANQQNVLYKYVFMLFRYICVNQENGLQAKLRFEALTTVKRECKKKFNIEEVFILKSDYFKLKVI